MWRKATPRCGVCDIREIIESAFCVRGVHSSQLPSTVSFVLWRNQSEIARRLGRPTPLIIHILSRELPASRHNSGRSGQSSESTTSRSGNADRIYGILIYICSLYTFSVRLVLRVLLQNNFFYMFLMCAQWLPLLKDRCLISGEICLPVALELPPPANYSYITPDVALPGIEWVENHKSLFVLQLEPVSSIHPKVWFYYYFNSCVILKSTFF